MLEGSHQIPLNAAAAATRASAGRKKRLVRRAADIACVQRRVRFGTDQGHFVRADGYDRDSVMVGRKSHAMDEGLAMVERAEMRGRGIARPGHAAPRSFSFGKPRWCQTG